MEHVIKDLRDNEEEEGEAHVKTTIEAWIFLLWTAPVKRRHPKSASQQRMQEEPEKAASTG